MNMIEIFQTLFILLCGATAGGLAGFLTFEEKEHKIIMLVSSIGTGAYANFILYRLAQMV